LPENNRYEFAATGMQALPLPQGWRHPRLRKYAEHLDALARERQSIQPTNVLKSAGALLTESTLRQALKDAQQRDELIRRQMVQLQEELDWVVYGLYSLWNEEVHDIEIVGIEPDERPCCWSSTLSAETLPAPLRDLYRSRRRAIETDPTLRLLETPVY